MCSGAKKSPKLNIGTRCRYCLTEMAFNIIYSGAYLDRQFDDSGGHGRISYLHLLLSPE